MVKVTLSTARKPASITFSTSHPYELYILKRTVWLYANMQISLNNSSFKYSFFVRYFSRLLLIYINSRGSMIVYIAARME